MRKSGTMLALLLWCVLAQAQQRSESDAVRIAREFLGTAGQTASLSVVSGRAVEAQIRKNVAAARKEPARNRAYYVVNDEANGRFVIVSADERMYTVLGYSDSGTFDADNVPAGLTDMLYGYDLQYDYLLESADPTRNYNAKRLPVKAIDPLITSKWDQDTPYNALCPMVTAADSLVRHAYTGCVATTMAQVMNYYQYPNQGTGSISYTSGDEKFDLSMDFSTVRFDWQNMSDVYDDTSTDAQKNAVAKLMYTCGLAAHMEYFAYGSGAETADMAYALVHYFNYNPNLKYYKRDFFSAEEWEAIIQDDLTNGRPVPYGGGPEEWGHQFILDGCDTEGRYHFNFGWSGYCDGYYELSAIDLGYDGYNFSYNQDMLCNVTPETVGTHEDVFFADSVVYDKSEVAVGDKVKVTFEPECCTTETNAYGAELGYEVGIGVFDMDKQFVKSLGSCTVALGNHFYVVFEASLSFDAATFTDGSTYYIAPYAKAADCDNCSWIRTLGGRDDCRLASVNNGVVTLGTVSAPDIPDNISAVDTDAAEGLVNIYGIDGVLKKTLHIRKGGDIKADLPKGLYIAGGKKLLVK